MKNFTEKERISWLRLIRSERVGPIIFRSLIELYGTAERAMEAAPELSRKGGSAKPLKIISESDAVKEIENCVRKGARIVASCEEEYPKRLLHIKDYPPIITVFGKNNALNNNNIAIVGARNASANGCRFASKIAKELGINGFTTVSGLARGIDTAAHKESLTSGTIAVVAGGIDKIYPPENKDLFMQIAQNGAVIAEMPFGSVPKAQNFPRRNRIISGISLGVVVVEASIGSGSLITARMALEQNREIFAVPGSPLDPRCAGTNGLIKQGARLTESADDVIESVAHLLEEPQESFFDKEVKSYGVGQIKLPSEIEVDKGRPLVLEKLGINPVDVDEIILQTGLTPNIVLTILLELELAGRLDRQPGNKVAIIYSEEDFF